MVRDFSFLQDYEKIWEDKAVSLLWIDADIQKNTFLEELSGYGRNNLFYSFKDDLTKAFVSPQDLKIEAEKGVAFFSDEQNARKKIEDCKGEMAAAMKLYSAIWKADFSGFSDSKVFSLFEKLFEYNKFFLSYFELSQPTRLSLLEARLFSYFRKKKKQDIFLKLLQPSKPSIIIQESKEFEKICADWKEKGFSEEVNEAIRKHAERHMFLGAFETFAVWDEAFFKQKLLSFKPLTRESAFFDYTTVNGLDSEIVSQCKLIADYSLFRLELSQYWTTTIFLGRGKIFPELSKRFNLKEKIFDFISKEEFDKVKNNCELAIDIERRFFGIGVLSENGSMEIFDGNIFVKQLSLVLESEKKIDKGFAVSLGHAIGKARVIGSGEENINNALAEFQEGEILITQMTTPNLAPVFSKVAGIITDEGGITSHAAIISREFGIPCIVGTRNATKIFKTGDIIELDANHKTIKKLS